MNYSLSPQFVIMVVGGGRGYSVCVPHSLFMRSWLQGNTDLVKRAATQPWLQPRALQCCKPRKLDRLAHRV